MLRKITFESIKDRNTIEMLDHGWLPQGQDSNSRQAILRILRKRHEVIEGDQVKLYPIFTVKTVGPWQFKKGEEQLPFTERALDFEEQINRKLPAEMMKKLSELKADFLAKLDERKRIADEAQAQAQSQDVAKGLTELTRLLATKKEKDK
jgi:hypothetical protein